MIIYYRQWFAQPSCIFFNILWIEFNDFFLITGNWKLQNLSIKTQSINEPLIKFDSDLKMIKALAVHKILIFTAFDLVYFLKLGVPYFYSFISTDSNKCFLINPVSSQNTSLMTINFLSNHFKILPIVKYYLFIWADWDEIFSWWGIFNCINIIWMVLLRRFNEFIWRSLVKFKYELITT